MVYGTAKGLLKVTKAIVRCDVSYSTECKAAVVLCKRHRASVLISGCMTPGIKETNVIEHYIGACFGETEIVAKSGIWMMVY